MTILVTGGAGFIGSNFISGWFAHCNETVINLDRLSYAANLENLAEVDELPNYHFVLGDICNTALVSSILKDYTIRSIVHFAAESHVDNSIKSPQPFIENNIIGTFSLLEATRNYLSTLPDEKKSAFRFLHVSTDEIYGSLEPSAAPFTERHPIEPNSPYSASKAASNHLVHAYHNTYGLNTLITNCSNNYGPRQHTEKLVPLMIKNALMGYELPIYGDGNQIRDWLYVSDHCAALRNILKLGQPGSVYNIGGMNEKKNIEVAHAICDALDSSCPKKDGTSYRNQIKFVQDRLGHDRRYAINADKLKNELHWSPIETFETGLQKTILWYLTHRFPEALNQGNNQTVSTRP